MDKIYKYPFRITEEQIIQIPSGAKILSVQVQGETPCIWAAVNDSNNESSLRLVILGTGEEIHRTNLQYIDTIQLNGFVWHIFYDAS